MAKMGRASVCLATNGAFEVREFAAPAKIGDDSVLLKTELAGICGTDVHMWHGRLPQIKFPLIMGHENTGTVIEAGKNHTRDYLGRPIKPGDRLIVLPGAPCRHCYACAVLKAPSKCFHPKPAHGFKSHPEVAPHFTGGFGQYLEIYNTQAIYLKTDLPPEIAVILEPISCGLHGVDRIQVDIGDRVAVQGTGIIGLGAILSARLAGATRIVAVGGPKGRLELALRLGATHTIDIAEVKDPRERAKLVREYLDAPFGADKVIECAGVPAAFTEAITYVRDGGVVGEVGHFTDTGAVTFNPHHELLRPNITIHGVYGSRVEQHVRTLQILEAGGWPFADIVSHTIPLERIGEAFDILSGRYNMDGRDAVKIAVNPWL